MHNSLRGTLAVSTLLASMVTLPVQDANAALGFRMFNQTGFTIVDLYVKPINSGVWGVDRFLRCLSGAIVIMS